MNRAAFSGLLMAVFLAGCSAPVEDDEEGSAQAIGTQSVTFPVFGSATETKLTTYGTRDRLLGTARADKEMEREMLPRVRAAALESLRKACADVTNGAGRLEGSPRNENVRAERIYKVTEFVVELRNEQTCSAPRAGMEARAAELVSDLPDEQSGSTYQALLGIGEKAVAPTLAAIEARIGRDGKLDKREDAERNVTNWTSNHVVFLARLVGALKPTSPRALPVLRRLETAVAEMPWAADAVRSVIASL